MWARFGDARRSHRSQVGARRCAQVGLLGVHACDCEVEGLVPCRPHGLQRVGMRGFEPRISGPPDWMMRPYKRCSQ